MRKQACTGIFRSISFGLYKYYNINGSLGGTSLGSSEGYKYGNIYGLLDVISLG